MDLRENFVIEPESTSCKIVNFLLETRNRKKRKKKKKKKRRREASNLNPMNSKKYHLPLLFVGKKKRFKLKKPLLSYQSQAFTQRHRKAKSKPWL